MRHVWLKRILQACGVFILILGVGWLVLFLDTYIPYMTVTKATAVKHADSALQRRIRSSDLEAGNYSEPIFVSEKIGVSGIPKKFRFIAIPKVTGFPVIFISCFYSPNDRYANALDAGYLLPSDANRKRDLIEKAVSSWRHTSGEDRDEILMFQDQ